MNRECHLYLAVCLVLIPWGVRASITTDDAGMGVFHSRSVALFSGIKIKGADASPVPDDIQLRHEVASGDRYSSDIIGLKAKGEEVLPVAALSISLPEKTSGLRFLAIPSGAPVSLSSSHASFAATSPAPETVSISFNDSRPAPVMPFSVQPLAGLVAETPPRSPLVLSGAASEPSTSEVSPLVLSGAVAAPSASAFPPGMTILFPIVPSSNAPETVSISFNDSRPAPVPPLSVQPLAGLVWDNPAPLALSASHASSAATSPAPETVSISFNDSRPAPVPPLSVQPLTGLVADNPPRSPLVLSGAASEPSTSEVSPLVLSNASSAPSASQVPSAARIHFPIIPGSDGLSGPSELSFSSLPPAISNQVISLASASGVAVYGGVVPTVSCTERSVSPESIAPSFMIIARGSFTSMCVSSINLSCGPIVFESAPTEECRLSFNSHITPSGPAPFRVHGIPFNESERSFKSAFLLLPAAGPVNTNRKELVSVAFRDPYGGESFRLQTDMLIVERALESARKGEINARNPESRSVVLWFFEEYPYEIKCSEIFPFLLESSAGNTTRKKVESLCSWSASPPNEKYRAAIHFYGAQHLYDSHDTRAAQRILADLCEAPDGFLDRALILDAMCFERLGNYDEALACLRRVPGELPDSPLVPHATFMMAWVCLQQNKQEEGRAILRDLIAAFPKSPSAGQAERLLAGLGKR